MTSLGYRRGCDHNSSRPGEMQIPTAVVQIPAAVTQPEQSTMSCVRVPAGFLPLVLYSALALVAPVLYDYADYDWTDNGTRVGLIIASVVYALSVVFANNCLTWFNMVLFFHIGAEVRTLDTLMTFARASTTTTGDEVLAWITFVVVIVHLLPFLLNDNTKLLTLFAFAGVIVNSACLVYLDSTRLLLVGFSSMSLLGTTLCISGVCDVSTSLMTAARSAIQDNTWVTCSTYNM